MIKKYVKSTKLHGGQESCGVEREEGWSGKWMTYVNKL